MSHRPKHDAPAGPRPAAFLVLVLTCFAVPAQGALRHGVVWYSNPRDEAVVNLAARRYELGVTGKEVTSSKVAIKKLNHNFKWFVYNSLTDNYVPPSDGADVEDAPLVDLCRGRGWDPEEGYLHYVDDTRVVLQKDTLLVRGWGDGSAASPSEARVPVYYKDRSRRLTNFSTPRARLLQKTLLINLALDTPFAGTDFYPDGIFLDNAAARLFNFGQILSGGHVRETPGHLRIDTPEFQQWHEDQNVGPFLSELEDTLRTSASWSRDHRRKLLMINVSSIWSDAYVSRREADVLFLEFQYNPVRNPGRRAVLEAFRRDSLAATADIACFYAPSMSASAPGKSGVLSYEQVLLGNLAWFLVSRTEKSIFFEMANATPHVAGWDTLTWRGCVDVADRQLGEAVGSPFVLQQGTDGRGNPYVVTGRNYERGLALIRNRGEWSQSIEPETAVRVPLPAPLAPVHPSGAIGVPVKEISLRNGEGLFLLGDPRPSPGGTGKSGPGSRGR